MQPPKKFACLSAYALATTLACSAQAVQLSSNGEGEALILPYYTVRNGHATLISIVNASEVSKVVSLLVREGKNSTEDQEFQIYLAKGDVWTGAITESGDGARMISSDTGCLVPTTFPVEGAAFSNVSYSFDVSALRSLDRTKEGHIEIVELASILPGSPTDLDITPDASGRRACALTNNSGIVRSGADYRSPTGGVLSSATIVGPSMSSSYQAIALQGLGGYAFNIGTPLPVSLAVNATSNRAFIHETDQSGVSRYIVAEFDGPFGPYDAVQAVLTQASITGEYATDEVFATDWILTMPTKRISTNGTSVRPPFQNAWNGRNANATPVGTACDDMSYRLQDRETKATSASGAVASQLCWSSNVVGIKSSSGNVANSTFASINASTMTVASPGSGWGTIDLTGAAAHRLVSNANSKIYTFALDGTMSVKTGPITFHGLPVVGIALYSAKFPRTQDNYSSSANLVGRARITQ